MLEILHKTLKFSISPFTLGDGYESDVIALLGRLGITTFQLISFLKNNLCLLNQVDTDEFINKYPEEHMNISAIEKLKHTYAIIEYEGYKLCFNDKTMDMFEFDTETGVFHSFGLSDQMKLLGGDYEKYISKSNLNGCILERVRENILNKAV